MKKKTIGRCHYTIISSNFSSLFERFRRGRPYQHEGDVITEHQFYEQVKSNPSAQQVLLNLTIQKVFEKQYGSEVDDKEVNDTIAEEEKQYGENYQRVLSQAGMTLETRKAQIRTSKLVELAVKKAAEAELTDDAYKKAFDEYTPDVTAQIIRLDNEDKAKEILEKAKASDADFAQLAKDNSTDEKTKANGGEITFDSASTEVPDQVKKAAFALDVNGVSDVISVTGTQAYSSQYYIVKLIKKTEKSSNIDDYKEKLKTVILTQKQNDASLFKALSEKNCRQPTSRLKTKPSKISLLNTSVVEIQAQAVLQKNKTEKSQVLFFL